MRRAIKSVLAVSCLPGIGMGSIPALAQMRGPGSAACAMACVANWERRFQMISPETWEMTMGPNDRDPFIFRETSRSTGSIRLQSVHNRRLKAVLNLGRQRIKYIIPGQEYDRSTSIFRPTTPTVAVADAGVSPCGAGG